MIEELTLSHEFNAFHDCVGGVIWEKTGVFPKGLLTEEVLQEYWKKLPDDIKLDAARWGVDDSVVRDDIYVHLMKTL